MKVVRQRQFDIWEKGKNSPPRQKVPKLRELKPRNAIFDFPKAGLFAYRQTFAKVFRVKL